MGTVQVSTKFDRFLALENSVLALALLRFRVCCKSRGLNHELQLDPHCVLINVMCCEE